MTSNKTWWRGVETDTRTADQLTEAARIVGPDIQLTPTQGSWRPTSKYSASTHSGAGAVDLSVIGLDRAQEERLIIALNAVGIVAWIREAIAGLWPRHCHLLSIPAGWQAPSLTKWLERGELHPTAWDQITAARNGRDGLASNGPDPHAHLRTWRTWEQYDPTAPTPGQGTTQEEDMASIESISDAAAAKIARFIGDDLEKRGLHVAVEAVSDATANKLARTQATVSFGGAKVGEAIIEIAQNTRDRSGA